MSDIEPGELDFLREEIDEHYSIVWRIAKEETHRSGSGLTELGLQREDYVKLASSPDKKDRDRAAQMRVDLKFQRLDFWRATNVQSFFAREACAPGSEFLAYAWLQEEREYLRSGLKYATNEKLSVVERAKLEDKELVAVSSCIVDMERRFPAGIPTFRATEAFLRALPGLVQGPVDVAHGVVNKVFGR